MAAGGGLSAIGVLLIGLALVSTIDTQAAPPPVKIHTLLPINSLRTVPVPKPPGATLTKFVADEAAAVRLGKALFWDMQVGSDNVQACASCHFAAGADNRVKNQVSPGLNAGDHSFSAQIGGPNHVLTAADYPFHKLTNPEDTTSPLARPDVNDVASSQGVVYRTFGDANGPATPGGTPVDSCANAFPDPDGFVVGNVDTRRVEPRNAPTVINAVFNYRNFWDGRAQFYFNGVNPFGARDPNAKVWSLNPQGKLQQQSILIPFSSLASQAVGPPGSKFEMSCDGRVTAQLNFAEIGQKLVNAKPLALQTVAQDDSQLADFLDPSGKGLKGTYADMIKAAFQPQWWAAPDKPDKPILINGQRYSQMEANFSLFFGLAVQLYEATLVADKTKFDLSMDPVRTKVTLDTDEQAGLALFTGKAHCSNCHGGAELTNASVRNVGNEHLERMIMGNDGVAVYDNGFYNIGVRPTPDDLGVGGNDPLPLSRPLSETALCLQQNPAQNDALCNAEMRKIAARPLENIPAAPLAQVQCPAGTPGSVGPFQNPDGTFFYTCDRIAVKGAFKAPSLRNVELTGPYFHNGGQATLRQVVDFYNRKGDFAKDNEDDLDPDIVQLGLSETERNQLVAFLVSLTDDRVRKEQEPFDHPSLCLPNGHPGDEHAITSLSTVNGVNVANDDLDCSSVPAVGKNGSAGIQGFTARLGLSQTQP